MGKKWDYEIPSVAIWEEVYRVLKPGAHILAACGTRTQHRMAVNIEDAGFEIRDVICWHYGSGFPKSMDISKAIDKAAGVERKIVGENKYAGRGKKNTAGSNIYDAGSLVRSPISAPSTDTAKQWDGWGTALKPATEFWTLARKPISEKTVAANILRWGVGGLNIDACKIGEGITRQGRENNTSWGIDRIGKKNNIRGNKAVEDTTVGRFPANLILDDFMAEEMDLQSGILKSGGASRFFYVAKPSAEERGDTSHVTVKPQTLIQYLIKLICPIEPGRTVLEPFAGSGSHCIAARKLGLDFIASEIDELSCREANERLTKEMGLFI